LLGYLQEAISLKVVSNSSEEIAQKILTQIKKLLGTFPDNLLMKIKEV
jgi:hypothetical protein